jgi:hypothetical protein
MFVKSPSPRAHPVLLLRERPLDVERVVWAASSSMKSTSAVLELGPPQIRIRRPRPDSERGRARGGSEAARTVIAVLRLTRDAVGKPVGLVGCGCLEHMRAAALAVLDPIFHRMSMRAPQNDCWSTVIRLVSQDEGRA